MALETCVGCSTRYAVGLAACPNCRSTERTAGGVAVVPLMADTACTNSVCGSAGIQRRVVLSRPALGVVELPTLLCAGCGHVLPLAWPGPGVESDGDSMSPKITRKGGASNKRDPENAAAAEPEPTPEAAADQPERFADGGLVASPEALREHARNLVEPDFSESLAQAEADETAEEGGEEPSPGSSSSTSTEKPSDMPEPSKPTPRKRTRAASRSIKARTENSSASSPDTSGPETDALTDDET